MVNTSDATRELYKRADERKKALENILEAIEDRRSLATIKGIALAGLNDRQAIPDQT